MGLLVQNISTVNSEFGRLRPVYVVVEELVSIPKLFWSAPPLPKRLLDSRGIRGGTGMGARGRGGEE